MDFPLLLKNYDGSSHDIGNKLWIGTYEFSKLNFLSSNLASQIKLWSVGYILLLKLYEESNPDMYDTDKSRKITTMDVLIDFVSMDSS